MRLARKPHRPRRPVICYKGTLTKWILQRYYWLFCGTFKVRDGFWCGKLILYVKIWQNLKDFIKNNPLISEECMDFTWLGYESIPLFVSRVRCSTITSSIDTVTRMVLFKMRKKLPNVRCGANKVSKFGWKFYLTKGCPILFKHWHFLDKVSGKSVFKVLTKSDNL